jgi:DNA gyrase subunit A
VLLTTALGQCIRFSIDEVRRVRQGRDSTGVRGIAWARATASMISMHQRALARALGEEGEEAPAAVEDSEEDVGEASLSPERIAELGAAEEILLTVSSEGFGKRTSAYDYRRTGRGGQGLTAQDLTKRGGKLVGSFPVDDGDQILLVTDAGQLIRVPVSQIRVAARNTQGVTIFRTAQDEHVVSVERLADAGGDDSSGDENEADETS